MHAEDGWPLREGTIIVAPPDRHLSVQDGIVRVTAGPRENGHRPSADILLRSVAEAFRARAAGVILSGTMDDGAAGLRAIRTVGGMAVVQDPDEAAFPGMPAAAIEAAEPQLVCQVAEMGARLDKWASRFDGHKVEQVDDLAPEDPVDEPDAVTEFTCPECGGTLWAIDQYGIERYRCRVGHAFSGEGLMLGKKDAVEAALWAAIVALKEKADLSRRIGRRLELAGRTSKLERYRRDVAATEAQAEFLREMVEKLNVADHAFEKGSADAGSAS